jgi:transcriptional regulator with XRE-family HTH domain
VFSTYNLSIFGKKLKAIRKTMGFTQHDVSQLCGINRDTLRRIEQGDSIPRYDTLELLSSVYKVDLLDQLKLYRSSNKLYSYYHRLDKLITNADIDTLNTLADDYVIFIKDEQEALFDPNLYTQFQWMLKGISAYYSEDGVKKLQSLDLFLNSIRLSIPTFDVYEFQTFKYNIFEMRILLLIALSIAHNGLYHQSNLILKFLLNAMLKDSLNSLDDVLLTIKIYANLSYNAFNLDDYKNSLNYSNQGIAYCNKHTNYFSLHLLFFRKGIALFRLNKEGYLDPLHKSIQLLEIQENYELARNYKQVLLDRYNIEV